MSVMRASVGWVAVVAVVAGLTAGGCVKQRPTMSRPPAPENQPRGGGGIPARFQPEELDRKSGQFAEVARRLPGNSREEHRQLMRQAFTLLAEALPLTVGPNRGGVFEHQLSVVNDTRAQLQDRSTDLSIDPIVNNGMTAVYNALDDAARSTYPSESEIAQGVRDYGQKLDEIYTFRGTARWPRVAEAMRGVSEILRKMSESLATRGPGGPSLPPPPEGAGPTTGPTTGPAEAMPPDAPPPDAPAPYAPEVPIVPE